MSPGSDRSDGADTARVVQLSDTHLSAAAGVPAAWTAAVRWLHDDPPDLVVHSGDIVLVDPDDDEDRRFARDLVATIPGEVVVIPGNHDVGFYDEEVTVIERRVATFRATWGDDRFVRDLAGWRLVGIDAYVLGQPEHDAWFREAVAGDAPVLVFVHQPVRGDRDDGWQMSGAARAAFDTAIAGADVRVVASGHRHCWRDDGRDVWAPSLTLHGSGEDRGDPAPGFLEHRLGLDGTHVVRVIRTA